MLEQKVNNTYKIGDYIFNIKRNLSRWKEYEAAKKHYHCMQCYREQSQILQLSQQDTTLLYPSNKPALEKEAMEALRRNLS